MKNKFLVIIIMTLAVAASWIIVFSANGSTTNRVNELKQQVSENVEVRTYKNTIPLYKELINLEPEQLDWYVGLADAYQKTDQYGNYQKTLNKIVSLFPEEKVGYLRSLELLAELGKDQDLIHFYNDDVPESMKNDEDILAVYRTCEWSYQFLSTVYEYIGPFSNGFCVVKRNGEYGYRKEDNSGDIECQFDLARPFIEDIAAVKDGGEWFFIDYEGDRVLASKDKIEDLYSFSENYAAAKIDGKYGYIDKYCRRYSFEYDDATSFYNGIAAVKKGGKWALIDAAFQPVTDFIFEDIIRDEANICSRRGYVFAKKDNGFHLLNLDGSQVCSETFEDAKLFLFEYAPVRKNGKWGFIDYSGNVCIDCSYDDASSFGSGIAAVCKDGAWGCVDLDGNKVLDFDYNGATASSNRGVICLKIGESYRLLQFLKYK